MPPTRICSAASLTLLICAALPWTTTGAEEVKSPGIDALVAKDSPLRPGEAIAFLGDSITQGGAQPGGYVWLIEQALTKQRPELVATVIKAGISGHKVPDLQGRLDRDVLAKKPTVVFVYIGINDVWHSLNNRGTPKDKYEAGLRDLIKRIKDAGAVVVLATPSTIGEKTDGSNQLDKMLDEYAEVSRKVATDTSTPLCDLHEAFLDYLKKHNPENKERGVLTGDGVHLNAAGNRFVADQAAAAIVAALKKRKPAAADARPPLSLVPQPRQVERLPGQFVLKPDTEIIVDKGSADAISAGRQLAERVRRSTSLDVKVSASDRAGKQPGAIRITAGGADASLGSEGYRLDVAPDGVLIIGGGAPGMFYGTQTLLQLLPPQVFSRSKVDEPTTWAIPAVRISDRPRFGWRGLLLDVARHFFTKDELKDFIDLMAQHKLNTLQIHFTDDQGWRLEIKKYPKLTEVAAWRKSIGFGLDPKDSTAWKDGRYGGFYTQDDIRELVAYARDRYVTIVPEIEMPGHAGGALSAYPEFSCFGGPYDRDAGPMGIFCPGNDEAFTFLENVLAEVIRMFPGKYVHIGGDEVDKATWKKCPKCQARIKKEGLKDEQELQSYFVKRIERFINSQQRTLIGWDEILEGGLAPNATVMSWRNVESGVVAAGAGHDVVMTPTSHCYFDYLQAKTGEPRGIGGLLPLTTVYSFEPLPAAVPADKAKHILGAGGNLWSEFFPNYAQVQYMAYPRACAMAEVTWTDAKRKDWDDFKRRLETQLERLKAQGAKYRAPKPGDPGY